MDSAQTDLSTGVAMKEMSLKQLAGLLDSDASSTAEGVFSRVVQDSRQAQPGDLFLPFQGRYVNGHQHIQQALKQGASALAQREFFIDNREQLQGKPVLPVDDVSKTLLQLAAEVRGLSSTRFIAITGSNGKTTLKELLYHLLLGSIDIGCSPGNLNSTQGVPLTICNNLADQEWFIAEIGANLPGEIGTLSRLVQPELGVITNIGHAHAGLLGGLEGVRRAKSELWEGLLQQGTAVVPLDDELVVSTTSQLPGRVTCSLDKSREADFTGELLDRDDQGHYRLRIEGEGFICPLPGRHGAGLALIAWTLARVIGMNAVILAERMATGHTVTGRFVIHDTSAGRVIDDSYNASPESMRAALTTMAEMPVKGRRIAVLAAMGELGEWSAQLHREVARYASTLPIDHFLVLGEDARELFQELSGHKELFLQPEELLRELRQMTTAQDLILFKGSNAYRLSDIIKGLLH
jgi:UDP-N-acetylmuramoyl-tripeptide--D-alanyl-D-alanine ligase